MQRRMAIGGWLCAIVLAALVGTWSFQNANPDAQYASHEPLDESAVRHELSRGRSAGTPGAPGTASPSEAPTTASPSSSPPASSSAPPRPGARTVELKLPHGGATATAQCRADGRIRLLGLSPAHGYGVDDVVYGPARYVSFELEPLDDEDGDDDAHAEDDSAAEDSSDDLLVKARCTGGKPRASVTKD